MATSTPPLASKYLPTTFPQYDTKEEKTKTLLPKQRQHQANPPLPSCRPYKAGDFEGAGGPEDKARAFAEAQGGSDAIRSNIRQGGETVRPAGSMGSDAVGGTGKQTGQESG